MMSNPTSQNMTWDFMRQNFDEIMKKTGGGLGGVGVFLYGAESFCSTQKANEVKQFFDQHPFPGTERNQKEAIESINSCVELGDQQQNKLAAWLKQNGSMNASGGGGGSQRGRGTRRRPFIIRASAFTSQGVLMRGALISLRQLLGFRTISGK